MSTQAKEITTTTHPDGRKDVKIQVNRLDINPEDQATKEAKEIIETRVLPKLAETPVLVVVLHKPSNKESHKIVKLKHVRAYAEAAIEQFNKIRCGGKWREAPARNDDFVVVEHHLENGQVKVTTL